MVNLVFFVKIINWEVIEKTKKEQILAIECTINGRIARPTTSNDSILKKIQQIQLVYPSNEQFVATGTLIKVWTWKDTVYCYCILRLLQTETGSYKNGLPGRWLPTGHQRSRKTTAFSLHEDADCPPNIQLFWGDDFCSLCHKSLEQFVVKLKKIRHIIFPVEAVVEDILFGQPDHGALWTILTAPFRNILTCLLI